MGISIGKPAKVKDENGRIKVIFNNGFAVFDSCKGLVNYTVNGKNLLLEQPIDGLFGFVPHIFRGTIDNDRNLMIFWKILGLDSAKAKLKCCKSKEFAGGNLIHTSYNFVSRGIFVLAKAVVDYYFDENGNAKITASLHKICPLTSELPRFGVHCEMISDLKNISYYGMGPGESYSDFKEHTTVGIFGTTVKNMAHKYIKPQDSGNRTEVRFSHIYDDGKTTGITFNAYEKYFNFNANPYTLNELINAKHIEDLPDKNVSFVSVDGFVRGAASGSCGPAPSAEHKISFGYSKPLSFTFEISPE
ncbi:MAG: beta-galactosidase small subunit [Clostridiales bacterium]|nr:beta-galactosidase small subunit [Clostridiales bacterium]